MATIEWLNYHHLHYFWKIAHVGSLSRAAKELHLTHQTLSSQLKNLEEFLGGDLFLRTGRAPTLTLLGREVLEYADEIFRTGNELVEMVRGRAPHRTALRVGIAGRVPRAISYRLLLPAIDSLDKGEGVAPISLRDGGMPELLDELLAGHLHLVLSNFMPSEEVSANLFAHLLEESNVLLYGAPQLARRYASGFPHSLNNAPMLLPGPGTRLRSQLDQWFTKHDIKVQVRGEFDDPMLMAAFGKDGRGLFPVPSLLAVEMEVLSGVNLVAEAEGISEQFYAILTERRVRRAELRALLELARQRRSLRK